MKRRATYLPLPPLRGWSVWKSWGWWRRPIALTSFIASFKNMSDARKREWERKQPGRTRSERTLQKKGQRKRINNPWIDKSMISVPCSNQTTICIKWIILRSISRRPIRSMYIGFSPNRKKVERVSKIGYAHSMYIKQCGLDLNMTPSTWIVQLDEYWNLGNISTI